MGSGGSKNKKTNNQGSNGSNYDNFDPSQQAMGNLTQTLPPAQANVQRTPTLGPAQTAPMRQQTQAPPVKAQPISQSQTPGTQSVNQSMHSIPQSMLPSAQQPMNSSQPTQRMNNEREQMPIQEQDDFPNTLFLFDFYEKVFYYYNTVSNEWKYNDLTAAMDNCPRCPLMKYRQDGEEGTAVQFGKYMSYIALNDDCVYLIGGYNSFFSCLVYNFQKNVFFTRKPINACRNNPSLCRYNGYIYAVSGDQIDTYSTDVSVYDTQNDEWNALPELPYPQGHAAVSVIYGRKLAVLGGLTMKLPKTYTPLLSIYTFGQLDWEVFDLTKVFTQRIPRFVNCSMVQNREGDLIVLGCEGTKNVFKIDLENLQLSTCGRIPEEDTFSMPMKSKELLFRNNLVHCLSHKLELKVYQGYLTLEKWEVV